MKIPRKPRVKSHFVNFQGSKFLFSILKKKPIECKQYTYDAKFISYKENTF